MNGQLLSEREKEATHRGALAHVAAQKLEEATRAVRHVEAVLTTAFDLVREAERYATDAGLLVAIGMNEELTAAFHVWSEADAAEVELPEALR